MKHFRKSGGFTLVELVVSIAVASLVTMAATTVLMLALRVNRQTSDTASKQYTVRTLLTAMENAAIDGSIKGVKTDYLNYWELLNYEGEESSVVFRFSAFDKRIYVNDIPVLEGVQASSVALDGKILNIVLVTKDGTFDASIYCRTLEIEPTIEEQPVQPPQEEMVKEKFIRVLVSQLGSRGTIQPEKNGGKYYSQWYIGDDVFNDVNNDWNPSTPWCACYISWALEEAGLPGPGDYKTLENGSEIAHGNWFSDVNDFMVFFQQEPANYGQSWSKDQPDTGGLIFFNLDGDAEADHIGVVLNVYGGIVHTIEGNKEGKVTVASYTLDDPRILGYGKIFS